MYRTMNPHRGRTIRYDGKQVVMRQSKVILHLNSVLGIPQTQAGTFRLKVDSSRHRRRIAGALQAHRRRIVRRSCLICTNLGLPISLGQLFAVSPPLEQADVAHIGAVAAHHLVLTSRPSQAHIIDEDDFVKEVHRRKALINLFSTSPFKVGLRNLVLLVKSCRFSPAHGVLVSLQCSCRAAKLPVT